MVRLLSLIILMALVLPARANEPPSTVTIPVADYLELKKKTEKASVTTLEEVRITGDYAKKMAIIFSGASTGNFEPIAVLQETAGVSLYNCSGAALLKADQGTIQLVPTSGRFKLSCDIDVKAWQNLSLTVLNALFLRSEMKGVDPIFSGNAIGSRNVTFHQLDTKRNVAEAPLSDEPSFVARYQISVLPEEAKFQYVLYVDNPGRSPKTFHLTLPNKEVVSHIETSNTYEDAAGGAIFKLAPGTSRIRITGRLPDSTFRPLLGGKALEYLLVDNHPLLGIDLKGGGRKVSVKDSGMSPSFAGAQSFLLSANDQFAWQAKPLEVFSSLSYAVTGAIYRYYASTQSSALVEANFMIDNQGSPEIPIKIPGHATYLSINGVPQVLTKDKDSQLLLRLPTGAKQRVLVQYQTENKPSRAIASVSEELARPSSLMSNVKVFLQVPGKRKFLFAKSLDDTHAQFTLTAFVCGAIAFGFYFFFLGAMGWSMGSRLAASLSIGAIALSFNGALIWLLGALLVLSCVRNRHKLMSFNPRTWHGWAAAAFVVLAVCMILAGVTSLLQSMPKTLNSVSEQMNEPQAGAFGAIGSMSDKDSAPMPAMAPSKSLMLSGASRMKAKGDARQEEEGETLALDEDAVSAAAPAPVADTSAYQGLPAKIVMPNDGYSLQFYSGMLDSNGPLHLRFITVATWVSRTLSAFLVMLIFGALYLERRSVREYLHLA